MPKITLALEFKPKQCDLRATGLNHDHPLADMVICTVYIALKTTREFSVFSYRWEA